MRPSPLELIAKKRDGGEHDDSEIEALIARFLDGSLADYQMSAWLMAAYLRGLSDREMLALTLSMRNSGKRLGLSRVRRPRVDKHSTGGVGDKISIPLAPLVAEAGLAVPMISGRGLGHTGGTLDKLAAIPGFRTDLDAKEFERSVAKLGVAIIGQTSEMAPADRRIYALRDVTGTVACRPLIVASILSKKLSVGLDALVLDVKVGRGAFMKTAKDARALASSLVSVATSLGTPTRALLTDMDRPLGSTIGNALEVEESIEILRGEGPEDTTELTLELAAHMCLMGGLERTPEAARKRVEGVLRSGHALERFRKMVENQGGDPKIVDQPNLLPRAPKRLLVEAPEDAYVRSVDPLALAEAALALGAGRLRAEDPVDLRVGLRLLARPGQAVRRGEPVAEILTAAGKPDVRPRVRAAFAWSHSRPRAQPLVRELLGADPREAKKIRRS